MAKPQDIPKDYIIGGVEILEGNVLGEGAYGVVKLGKYFSLPCAVKKLKASMFPMGLKQLDQQSEFILQSFYNECEKLCRIRHPNIVQFLGAFLDKQTHLPVLVMELMHESLSRLLHRTKSLPLYLEVNICHDVAQALAYLHSFRPPIVHRDLSSNNVLVSEEYRAKITDLGVAKVARGTLFNWDNTPAPGTLAYMPPEVRKIPADLSPAMDIFALGVNAIQIKTHKFPQPGPEFTSGVLGFSKMVPERERRKAHLDLMPRSHPLRSVIVECLKDHPKERPSALKLCIKFEKIEEEKEYQESLQIAKLKEGNAEDVMQQISDLEQKVELLRSDIAGKDTELERLKADLDRERVYTGELLEARARDQIALAARSHASTMNGEVAVDSEGGGTEVSVLRKKKKSKNPFHFIRQRSRKSANTSAADDSTQQRKSDELESGEHQGTAISPQPSPQEISDSLSPMSDNGFFDVTDTLAREAKSEAKVMQKKMNQLHWYSHNCLPQGLHGSTLRVHECNENLYLCGGALEDGTPNKAVYYCPVRNNTRWSKVTTDAPQYYCGSAIINEELVLIGGLSSSSDRCTKAISSCDNKTQIWMQRLPPLPTPRSSAAAVVCGNYLVVVGGQNEDGEAVSVVEVLHIPSQSWETAAGLPIKVAGQSVSVCGDTVYLLGGSNGSICLRSVFAASIGNIISSCRRFALFAGTDRSGKVWKQVSDCPFTMMVAVSNRDQLFALGGVQETNAADNVPAELIWIFEHSSWTPIQNMPSPHRLCCSIILSDNTMLIIGGEPDFGKIDIADLL